MKVVKRVQRALDIKRRLPRGYVHKWVFRGAILTMGLLALITFAIEGPSMLKPRVSMACPLDGPPCENPLYSCVNDLYAFDRYACEGAASICEREPSLCEIQTLAPGTSYGQVPGWFARHAPTMMGAVFFAAFPINHLLWRKKKA